jgi:predicted secreted protein
MKNSFAVAMGIVLMGVWAATLAVAAGEEEMAVFMMSDKDETCIRVAAGKPFAIRFATVPGTGYSWELAAEPDPGMLSFLQERPEEAREPRLGGAEYVTWTFQALAAGETAIAMKYVRPWEKDAPAAKKHVFKVRIR